MTQSLVMTMPPTDSQYMEKLHNLEMKQLETFGKVETLHDEKALLWTAVDKIRDTVGAMRVQVAGIVAVSSLFQSLITAYLVWRITKG